MLEACEILNASVLIVDDQEANVKLLEQMLHNAGYRNITSTRDPRTVCGLHAAHRYDLILLDLHMPEVDGFEVMEGLKEIETGGYLPVLVITAQPGHKLRALRAGAKDFVSKPFDLVEVQTRIHNMLEVRLLYKKLDGYNKVLERTVQERTAELRESEARFKAFTELSSDWYWEQDAQGQFTKYSGPVFDMLGIETDVTGGAGATAFAGSWNATERAALDAHIAARRPFIDLVYSRRSADGATQYLQVSGEPMFDSASRFIGYRGIGMDISDRMRGSPQQVRFRRALDMIDQGIFLVDRTSLCLVDANEATCRLTGYDQAELSALDLTRLGMGNRERLNKVFDTLVTGGAPQTQTANVVRKDSSTITVMVDWHASCTNGAWIIAGVLSAAAC
jgi:PAS domain S-box-containing protein